MNSPRLKIVALAALALALLPGARAHALASRPLPAYVQKVTGATPAPGARPWNLDPSLGGPHAQVSLPDGLGELRPYPLPTGQLDNPAGDPVIELLADGLEALKNNKLDEAAYAFTTGMRGSSQSPAGDACAFWLGEVRRQKGLGEEASVAYSRVKGVYRMEAAYRLARLLEERWTPAIARKNWLAIAEDASSPHRGEAYYRLAELENDPEAAILHLTKVLKTQDTASDLAAFANYRFAISCRQLARYREAERALSTLLLTRPDHPAAGAARVLQGWVELDQGHLQEAARALGPIEKDPAQPEALKLRALYGLAVIAAKGNDNAEYSRALAALALHSQGPWAGWVCGARGAALLLAGLKGAALAAYHEALVLWRFEGIDAVRFTVAQLHFEIGEFREAARMFTAISPEYRGAPEGLRRGAEILANLGEHAAARRLYERLLEEYPDFEERDVARMELGGELLALGKREEATAAIEATPPETPGREILLLLKGEAAHREGRHFEASEYLEKFEEHATGASLKEALLLHAGALKALEMAEEAADKYLRVAKLTKNTEEAATARLQAALLLLTVGGGEKGALELARLLSDAPGGPTGDRAHYALAEYRYGRGEYEEAQRHYAAVAASKDPALALLAKKGEAAALAALGRYEEALATYAKLGDDPDSLGGSALSLAKLGRVVEMAAITAKYAALYPGDPLVGELELKLADALMVDGKSGEAAGYYEKAAARLDKTRSDKARYMRGIALEGAGRVEEATAIYGALGAETSDPATRLSSQRRLAMLDLGAGKAKEAVERLKALLPQTREGGENEAGLLNDLAEASLASGDLSGGYEALRRASALAEGEEKLKTDILLGEFLEKSGKVNAALETYQRIAYHYDLALPLAARATLRGAALLAQAGRVEEAKELYRLAVKRARGSSLKKAAQELKELEEAPGKSDGNK